MNIERTNDLIHAVSSWIDHSPENLARDPEALLWGRAAKVAEEAGEVVAALIGATGQNPRKGRTGTLADVERELLDVAITALAALAHMRAGDPEQADVLGMLGQHVEMVARRAGLA
ncbi:hypothetical protein Sru01_50670 [Sphaerisporangium rufum]|uniref:NTP pyrophosphohydrolase MazG putative catalytic core domain-containing protein n=1 Tax=Sphaerisporangium rufum TaxID=1381558 RepID=A0A919V779_9ACTN|nr:MazG-like family protein [Sphaerisporangium rufum]GII80085.1 hypothetical protein Sru01_50670 [Sphaerisporangium rufum]